MFALLAVLVACLAFAGEPRLIQLDSSMVKDTKAGLTWQLGKSPEQFDTKEKAAQYTNSLNLCGYHDWHLPTLEERWDLLRVFGLKNNGGIEFPKFSNKYWTTETHKGTQPVKLDTSCMCRGDQEIEYKNVGYVRAARGSAPNAQ